MTDQDLIARSAILTLYITFKSHNLIQLTIISFLDSQASLVMPTTNTWPQVRKLFTLERLLEVGLMA